MIEIALNDIRLYCYHGFYEEERILGGWYQVDARVKLPEYKGIETDDLSKTINYESLHAIIKRVMSEPCDLLETLAATIRDEILKQYKQLRGLEITIKKLKPPLKGYVGSSECTLKSSFEAKDPITKKAFSCYKHDFCWCKDSGIDQATFDRLKKQSNGCISRASYDTFTK